MNTNTGSCLSQGPSSCLTHVAMTDWLRGAQLSLPSPPNRADTFGGLRSECDQAFSQVRGSHTAELLVTKASLDGKEKTGGQSRHVQKESRRQQDKEWRAGGVLVLVWPLSGPRFLGPVATAPRIPWLLSSPSPPSALLCLTAVSPGRSIGSPLETVCG